MSQKVLKFVFRCPALNERVVWWVSTEAIGEKMLFDHLHKRRSVRHDKYKDMKRGVDYFVEVRRMFGGEGLSGVGIDNCWG